MPAIIACPSCGSKLRVTDDLRGQKVRCPACHHTFDSAAEPDPPIAAPRPPQEGPLDLSLGEASSSPSTSSRITPGLIGALELSHPPDEPASPAPPRRPNDLLDRDIPDLRRLGRRRHVQSDRGAAVLSLGIISLALIVIWCTAPIGACLGLTAWIMGRIDLRKMKRGQMDDRNRGLTQAGWICGILGTILNTLITLSCGLFIGSVWYDTINRQPNTRPLPAIQPARPMPPKGRFPPGKNLPERDF